MTYGTAINVIAVLLILWALYRLINSDENKLEWTHLVSTKANDGTVYFDWNRVGQGCGVIVSVSMPFIYIHTDKMEATGLALVMAASLTYLGGVTSYSATLKSKVNK